MYTKEAREKAVELFIKYEHNESKVIAELGYPSPNALRAWYREYEATGNLHSRVERKERYTSEQIEAAVSYYISKKATLTQTCIAMGYPCRQMLRQWIKERHPEALTRELTSCKNKIYRVHYSCEQKERAVQACMEEHVPIYKVAAEYGVSKATISKWKRDLLGQIGSTPVHEIRKEKHYSSSKNIPAESDVYDEHEALLKELAVLKDEVFHLRMERDALEKAAELLKKAKGIELTKLSNLDKAGVIDALRKQYRLKDLLTLFGMSKSSYWYSHKVCLQTDKYQEHRAKIAEIFSQSNNTYGYRRVHIALKHKGIILSEKVIRRLMKESSLQVFQVRHKKYSSYRGEISPEVPNLLQRDFYSDHPNKKWLTDITEFALPAGKVYLSPMIDCFDGYVVSWTCGVSPSAELANRMLDQAVQLLNDDEKPIVHSDRGCHYRWPDWIRKMKEAGLTRSMSKKGCSPDNSACEGFFGRLKIEMFYGRSWQGISLEQFMNTLNKYILWYNTKRIKLSLGGISPAEYRRNLGY